MPNFPPIDHFDTGVPMLEDGKPANVAYLNRPHQALANRTHNLNETIKASGLTRQGATRIREVADEAALRALTGMADGELAITKDKGLAFRFRAGVSSPDIERWVVKPASGPGLWVNTAFQLIGGPNGLVAVDDKMRIPAEVPKNGVVELKSVAANLVQYDYSFEEWGEVELPLELSLQAGDVVHLDAGASVRLIGGATWAQMGIAHKTSPLTPIVGSTADVAVGTRHRVATCARFVASATEVHAFVIGVRLRDVGAGKGIGVIGDAILRATVYRP